MNDVIKKRWRKALKTYKQGVGCLRRDEDHFCCLGVLSDLWAIELGVKWRRFDALSERGEAYSINAEECTLSKEVRDWAEIDATLDSDGESMADRLANMNDSGQSFQQISDVIGRDL